MVVDGAGGADPLTAEVGPRGAASAVAARAAGAVAAVGGADSPPAGRAGAAGEADAAPQPADLPRTIAIDGPAGAGKSTVALELARRLGYFYFDTGALYRAVTLAALRRGLPLDGEARLARLIDELDIDVLPPGVDDGRTQTVTLDGEDVTWAIRAPDVDRNVSAVSAHGAVRRALLERQRQVAARGGVIMAGRDIGTVVLPDADLKLYLEASPPERAQRRAVEERARGLERPFPEVLAEIERRDDIDAHRAVSPLRRADDAILLDTEHLDFAGVLEQIEQILARRAERAPGERA